MKPREGRARVVIENVEPEIDSGRFAVKRTVGDRLRVEADIFTDGHDLIACLLQHRKEDEAIWHELDMTPLGNDRWSGEFSVHEAGRYRYCVTAWIDTFSSWRHDFARRIQDEDISAALLVGASIVERAAEVAQGADAERLRAWCRTLREDVPLEQRRRRALDDELLLLMRRHRLRKFATRYDHELPLVVDRPLAGFSAWYEFFPRSTDETAEAKHGSWRDAQKRLSYIAEMGFDVVYLPPVHPIGRVNRKGRNNALRADFDDPGSPWAIGAAEGGHKSVHPLLGTHEEFYAFVRQANELGLEVALDVAFQCAPDHPYIAEFGDWFRRRPDGSVQYAENPPKKYEDIYPFDFESEAWRGLWDELRSVFQFWVEMGVRIFRVDNPHTKPFAFWQWVIGEVKKRDPGVIFLSEAFSRPKIMYRLAKLGFTQSYTYFTWRNTKWELIQYVTELNKTSVREYFRPNFWPNTPDILPEYLQLGGRPAFMARLTLAATLSSNYGIYGPAFELLENVPRETGSEEYLNSEKYETRQWDLGKAGSLKDFVARINRIRRENPALQQTWNVHFYPVDNEQLICYGKMTSDLSNIVLVVVNLDSHHTQSGWVDLPIAELGLDALHPFQVHDVLSGARYLWHGPRNFVELNPQSTPAQIFRVRRRVRTERDFEYFF